MFRGMPIGTAAPTPSQLARVRHHFVGHLALTDYYSAAQFEADVMALLPRLWEKSDYAVMCGGSMMYIDAVCNGIDVLPTVDNDVRQHAWDIYNNGGLDALCRRLGQIDPEYLRRAPDLRNHKRLIHALEVSMQAGAPYSSLCTGAKKQRPFRIVKVAIDWPREILFDRINRRVEAMIEAGFEAEAARLYPMRHLNALNTVGYKELFAVIDEAMDRPTAIARIAKNTRVYAKKQLTWMRRDQSVIHLTPSRPLLPQVLNALPHSQK